MPDAESPLGYLQNALTRFVSGVDRSQEFVRDEIGAALEAFPNGDGFPDAALFEDLEVAVACYRPGGGQFMYDEEQAAAVFTAVLGRLDGLG